MPLKTSPLQWLKLRWRGLQFRWRNRRLQAMPVAPLPPVELAICAIFKDEALYLREWIEFHLLQGVERFYLYDNNSSDDSLQVLAPYIERGLVAVTPWPLHPAQINAYNHCVRWRRDEARWLAVLDCDEYLYTVGETSLLELLREIEPAPALAVNCILFSTSGHIRRPPGTLIENYVKCGTREEELIKSVVNPRRVERFDNPHSAIYRDGQCAVNENGTPVQGPVAPCVVERVRVNHYFTKSVEDFIGHRRKRGQADGFYERSLDELLDAEANFGQDQDLHIQRFIEPLRAALDKQQQI